MEWKEISRETIKCPCGESTYEIIREKNIWNRIRTTYKMNCSNNCPKTPPGYRIHPYEYPRNGLWHTGFTWVTEGDMRKMKILRESSNQCRKNATELAVRRYMKKWLDYFSNMSLRALWGKLFADKPGMPALPTFYKIVKIDGKHKILKRYFKYETVSALKLLQIHDPEIESFFKDADNLDAKADELIFCSSEEVFPAVEKKRKIRTRRQSILIK